MAKQGEGEMTYDFVDDAEPLDKLPSPKMQRQNRKRSSYPTSQISAENGKPVNRRLSLISKPSKRSSRNTTNTSLENGNESCKSTVGSSKNSPPRKKVKCKIVDSSKSVVKSETFGVGEYERNGGHEYKCTIGQEVLARWSDGLFYLGRVHKVDRAMGQCLVAYEDKSSFWALYKDLQNVPSKPLSIDEMVCNHCHSGDSDPPNQIVICDNCGIGYHQQCHKPAVGDSMLGSRESWNCRLCVFVSAIKKGGAHKRGANAKLFSKIKLSLPYETSSLEWDEEHLSNKQRCYCYCGGPGEWCMKMLQCSRCDQWFHEACLQCLDNPLLYGDRNYVFVCGVCNFGNEYIKRVPLKWLEIIQLALFNLTVTEDECWFETQTICTWIKQNQPSLQLDQTFHTLTMTTWRFHVGRRLTRHRLFTQGPKFTYGLREREPPPRLQVVLPPGVLNDRVVNEAIQVAQATKKSVEKNKASKRRYKNRTFLPSDNDVVKPKPRKVKVMSPLKVKVSKAASSTSLQRHADVAESTVTSGTDTEIDVDVVSVKDEAPERQEIDDNNNNYVGAFLERANDRFGFLNRSIPYQATFEGPRHPFKTLLEKEQELNIERKKTKILDHYGARYVSNSLVKNHFLTQEEERRRRNLHIVEVLQKKRGKKTEKEKKILEIADDVLGLKGSRKRKYTRVNTSTKRINNEQQIENDNNNDKLQKGEECEIKARRVLPNGEVQYLIVWRGIE